MANSQYFHPQTDWFNKRGLTPPESTPHGTDDDIRANLKSVNPTNWHLKGNELHADTDMGPLVQTIDPGHILIGVDANNLPIFRKVV